MDIDINLIKKAQKGDMMSFEKLVYKYEKIVYNLAYSVFKNEQDAYDISQEVFIKVYQSIDTFNFSAKFSTWLHRITINASIDELRKRKSKLTESIDDMLDTDDGQMAKQFTDETSSPEIEYIKKENRNEIMVALDELKPEHKVIITLRDIKGYSYEEIADILECSLGTVKSRLSRARINFKEKYIKLMEQNNKNDVI